MRSGFTIAFLLFSIIASAGTEPRDTGFYFYGEKIRFVSNVNPVPFSGTISEESFSNYLKELDNADYSNVITSLQQYRNTLKPDDWLFYQLIRKTAQFFSPKSEDYVRYTLYKWYFLSRTGYDAFLAISDEKVLFYVQSNESIYNIPVRYKNGLQYVCLNYHDYGQINFEREKFTEVRLDAPAALYAFSYKVTRIPSSTTLTEKDIAFIYNQVQYHFRLRINSEVDVLFKNYPSVDYSQQFNVPLSGETYASLIPVLKKQLKGMKIKSGVDFLMQFTRFAFLYKPDTDLFGQEKRFTPEQTLLSEFSDCEDRSALFFYLVREIYNLPMIVLAYPRHVTIAVQFEKPVGKAIEYKGKKYSICEPTPANTDLHIGQTLPELSKEKFDIVYVYEPQK